MITEQELLEREEELEQRAADMDAFEKEIEEEYSRVILSLSAAETSKKSGEDFKAHYKAELERVNEIHPALQKQLYITPNNVQNDVPGEALTVKLMAPRVGWDEKEDKGLVKLTYSKNGIPEEQVFAMSLGYFDSIDETILEGVVRQTAESINQQLWEIIKGRKQNG